MTWTLPEISLVSSWRVGPTPVIEPDDPAFDDLHLDSLRLAVQNNLRLLDLYFLSKDELPFFQQAAGKHIDPDEPILEFACGLTPDHIQSLADRLTDEICESFRGNVVGQRPRICALATYWPSISLPTTVDGVSDKEAAADRALRENSIAALQTSLYLAHCLGSQHVEIVGGASFSSEIVPLKDCGNFDNPKDAAEHASRSLRLDSFRDSLVEAYTNDRGTELFGEDLSNAPSVCVEVEPGDVFLINSVESFAELKETFSGSDETFRKVNEKVLLNIDVAHLMLTENLHASRDDPADQLKAIETLKLEEWIGHCHISDHARTHAADLCPGTYHFFEDYRKWFDLLIRVNAPSDSRFSGIIAIELEACADIHEVSRAIDVTRRWMEAAMPEEPANAPDVGPAGFDGAIVVIDIVKSTERFFGPESPVAMGVADLDRAIVSMCKEVHRKRGAVVSFRGDGLVAVFNTKHYAGNPQATTQAAYDCCLSLLEDEAMAIGLRFSLHYGTLYRPASAQLRYQILGPAIVAACMLCDCKELSSGESVIGASERAQQLLDENSQSGLEKGDSVEMKHLDNPLVRDEVTGVYVRRG